MSSRLLSWLVVIGLGCAGLVTLMGGGSGTGGQLMGRCVVLQGDAWNPSTCTELAAVAAETNPAPGGSSGDMGATAYGDVLTRDQIRDLWLRHGGDPAQADVAVAVALAESGGRPAATNTSNINGSIDRGLFQINSVHGARSTYDLDANVAYAVELQRAQGWSPWSAYKYGAYRRYLEASA